MKLCRCPVWYGIILPVWASRTGLTWEINLLKMNLLEMVATEMSFISECRELQFSTWAVIKLLFEEANFLYLSIMAIWEQNQKMLLLQAISATITGSALKSEQVVQSFIPRWIKTLQEGSTTSLCLLHAFSISSCSQFLCTVALHFLVSTISPLVWDYLQTWWVYAL